MPASATARRGPISAGCWRPPDPYLAAAALRALAAIDSDAARPLVEEHSRAANVVLRAVAVMLRQRFRVAHTTIQVEVEGCDPDTLYCNIHPNMTATVTVEGP